MERRFAFWLRGTVLIAAVVLGTAARAGADGGDTTIIHACVNNSDGLLRIVGPNTSCRPNQTSLHWPTLARIAALENRTGLGALCARSCEGNALALHFITTEINGNQVCPERPTLFVPCAPYTCLEQDGLASCQAGCNFDDLTCTLGNVCSQEHECAPYVFSCSEGPVGPQTGGTLEGTDGSTVSCLGYGCEGSICRVRCNSIIDCAPGYACNFDHVCVLLP